MMVLNSIKDTTLWKHLSQRPDDVSRFLAVNLIEVCREASDRMKAMPAYAPQFTLHDATHLLRTTELMSKVLGTTLDVLNSVEIALLILSAHFHDQGMIPDASELKVMTESPDFLLFRDNWYLEHPNRNETEQQLSNPALTGEEKSRLAQQLQELESALLTDYLRSTHSLNSAQYIKSAFGMDKRIEVMGVNLSTLTAKLCISHCQPASSLNPKEGLRFDEQVGSFAINMPYLAVILRISDILDFDRERTPDALYRTIHFTSNVSLMEWEKHRGVSGWSIDPERIRFTMYFEHPTYEAVARRYMDWIDEELSNCHELCRSYPAEFRRYELQLPQKVDRSRIGPKENSYIYHDLEFSLSRDEIVKLLMTDKLYNKPSLCIRELLQNSLDALRYRKAVHACKGVDWQEGKVDFEHSTDENGYEVIRCRDNGIGMDEKIITGFFCKAGRSYYRSPEFERQRMEFRLHNKDFDPCSQFGIGFMSCFMLGDRIIVETRRDYGPDRGYSTPLIVEINGLGSMLVIREGLSSQPVGTTVTIVSRKKPAFYDEWVDNVWLTIVLQGYAIATEFPIIGRCTIPEIADEVVIKPGIEPFPTKMEVNGLRNIITLEQPFPEIDERLDGSIRESFLINEKGLPGLTNSEGAWEAKVQGTSREWCLKLHDGLKIMDKVHRDVSVSIDGILLAGDPGRPSSNKEVRRLGWRNSNIYEHGTTILDVRGELKPEITPARTPVDTGFMDDYPGWNRLHRHVRAASGRLWAKVAAYLSSGMSHLDFWKLGEIYRATFSNMPHKYLWDLVAVSLRLPDGTCEWKRIRELGALTLEQDDELQLVNQYGCKIGPDSSFDEWAKSGDEHSKLRWKMNRLVLQMCSADIINGAVAVTPSTPINYYDVLDDFIITSRLGVDAILIPFAGQAADVISVQTYFGLANRNHPLSKIYMESKYHVKRTDLQRFASSFIPGIAQAITLKNYDISLEKPDRWHKAVAHQYFEVDWTKYNHEVKPPYKIWLKDKGWTQIGEDDFMHWKDIPLKKE